ncbi:MAG: O-antigen ligase family protein [Pseudomonadota bacterium]
MPADRQLYHRDNSSFSTAGLLTLIVGCLAGGSLVVIADADLRWLIVISLVAVFICLILAVPSREKFAWMSLVLSLQLLDPAVRLFYGGPRRDGLMFTLAFLIGLCVLFMYAVSGKFSRNYPFQWGGALKWPIVLLFATSAASLLHSHEKFIGVGTMLVQVELYVLYLIALNCVRSEEDLRTTLKWLFVTLGIQSIIYYVECIYGIYYISPLGQIITAQESELKRPGGTISHNPFGFANFILLIMLILIAEFLPARAHGAAPRWYKGILIGMGVIALILTLSRSAWISFLVGGAWLVIIAYRRRILAYQKILYIAIVAGVAAFVAAPLIVLRLQSSPLQRSYDERFALMQMAINVIIHNPIFGVGPGAYEVSYKNYLTADLADKWLWTVHNHYLLRTAETGIPGGLAWILLIVMGIVQALRLSKSRRLPIRTLAIGCGAGIVAVAQQMYWDMWTHVVAQELFWFLLGLMGAAEVIDRRARQAEMLATQRVQAADISSGR